MARYIKLGNGAVFSLDDVQVIVRKQLNEYAVVLRQCPVTILADLNDVESIENALEDLIVVPKPEMPASKLVVGMED